MLLLYKICSISRNYMLLFLQCWYMYSIWVISSCVIPLFIIIVVVVVILVVEWWWWLNCWCDDSGGRHHHHCCRRNLRRCHYRCGCRHHCRHHCNHHRNCYHQSYRNRHRRNHCCRSIHQLSHHLGIFFDDTITVSCFVLRVWIILLPQ